MCGLYNPCQTSFENTCYTNKHPMGGPCRCPYDTAIRKFVVNALIYSWSLRLGVQAVFYSISHFCLGTGRRARKWGKSRSPLSLPHRYVWLNFVWQSWRGTNFPPFLPRSRDPTWPMSWFLFCGVFHVIRDFVDELFFIVAPNPHFGIVQSNALNVNFAAMCHSSDAHRSLEFRWLSHGASKACQEIEIRLYYFGKRDR